MQTRRDTDPFAVLGLAPGAGSSAIRAAYRRLARQTHPDVRGGSVERFVAVREAYDALSDPQARAVWRRDARTTAAAPGSVPVEPLIPGGEVVDLRLHARLAHRTRVVVLDLRRPCATCAGEGVVALFVCPRCGGSGAVDTRVRARVTLPRSVRHGDVRRLRFLVDGLGAVELDARLLLS